MGRNVELSIMASILVVQYACHTRLVNNGYVGLQSKLNNARSTWFISYRIRTAIDSWVRFAVPGTAWTNHDLQKRC